MFKSTHDLQVATFEKHLYLASAKFSSVGCSCTSLVEPYYDPIAIICVAFVLRLNVLPLNVLTLHPKQRRSTCDDADE